MTGCGIKPKPFDYHPVSEMGDAPGLFTGEKGAVVIYNSTEASAAAERRRTPFQERMRDIEAPPPNIGPDEFRRFQEWKREQEEFETFRIWKQSPEGALEYEEFLEWRQWRAFKRWQESHSSPD